MGVGGEIKVVKETEISTSWPVDLLDFQMQRVPLRPHPRGGGGGGGALFSKCL